MKDALVRWCLTAVAMFQRLLNGSLPRPPVRYPIYAQCSWCGAINEMKPHALTTCRRCGHRADVERINCTCHTCLAIARAVRQVKTKESN